MIETVDVIGSGRVGSAVSARLRERGIAVGGDDPGRRPSLRPRLRHFGHGRCLAPGRGWVGHVSGATPLSALAPHERRFSLHPLQTFDRSGDPAQLDGAWAPISGETDEALASSTESLPETLGL